tara:strand:- start:4683 stop:5237 length:555 start_codon:yes stop_codon:yes gene_type:complete
MVNRYRGNMEKVFKLVQELAGEAAIPIAREIIEGKENVSEFKIAEKLEMGINQVRNLLYKLQKYDLITSTRKKDKKKGWYIYYWTFNMSHAESLFHSLHKDKLSVLKQKLENEETTEYYTCSKKCKKLDLIGAMDQDFKCQECGNLLDKVDNKKEIKQIQKEINFLENELTHEPGLATVKATEA